MITTGNISYYQFLQIQIQPSPCDAYPQYGKVYMIVLISSMGRSSIKTSMTFSRGIKIYIFNLNINIKNFENLMINFVGY